MNDRRRVGKRQLAAAIAAVMLSTSVQSHETDNYYLPLDRGFADLGSLMDSVHARVIQVAVKKLNAQIETALSVKDPEQRADRLRRLHDPDALVAEVCWQFNDAFTEVLDVEDALRGSWARSAYPGKISAHLSVDWMYTYTHFPLDPRRVVLLFQSSTIKAHGVYLGTDKLSHFHHMGRYYYDNYRTMLDQGYSPRDAIDAVIRMYATDGPLSEAGLLGFVATGIYSNADLAANYMGFKFLLNLTEPVMLEGELHAPLVDRCGVFWSVNARVRPESGWFGAFISDHWNEALNPSLQAELIRGGVRSMMRDRARHIVTFYTKRDGRPPNAGYYRTLQRELSTYYGENYGFAGSDEKIFTIGDTCLPALEQQALVDPATTYW